MKTLIKLLIMVALLNAVARAGYAALKYYQLRDAAEQTVVFGSAVPPEQLQLQIAEKAKALDIPLEVERLVVTRDGLLTKAQGSYTESVELFPSYSYPIPFSFAVEGYAVGMAPSVTTPTSRP